MRTNDTNTHLISEVLNEPDSGVVAAIVIGFASAIIIMLSLVSCATYCIAFSFFFSQKIPAMFDNVPTPEITLLQILWN